jgi:hypothetical protein
MHTPFCQDLPLVFKEKGMELDKQKMWLPKGFSTVPIWVWDLTCPLLPVTWALGLHGSCLC